MINDYTESAIGEPAESEKIYCMIERFVKDKKGLDIGCGGWKIIGSKGVDIRPGVADYVGDITQGLATVLQYKRKIRYEYIFSSHLLEDFDEKTQYELLRDWIDHLLPGGNLILYVPQKGAYEGCNRAHVREFEKGDIEKMFKSLELKLTDAWYESDAPSGGYNILMIGKKSKESDRGRRRR